MPDGKPINLHMRDVRPFPRETLITSSVSLPFSKKVHLFFKLNDGWTKFNHI